MLDVILVLDAILRAVLDAVQFEVLGVATATAIAVV